MDPKKRPETSNNQKYADFFDIIYNMTDSLQKDESKNAQKKINLNIENSKE